MSDWVSYKGRGLARFRIGNHRKKILVGESMKDLTTLFGLKDSEKVELESSGEKTFAEFKRDNLNGVSAIYPSLEEYLMIDYSAEQIKEFGL